MPALRAAPSTPITLHLRRSAAVLEGRRQGRIHPFDLAIKLLERIEKTFQEAKRQVTAGAGLVITGTLAADFCVKRAQALCKHAKSATDEKQSAIDFEVLLESSPLSDEIKAGREKEIRRTDTPLPGRDQLCLTQRPYSLPDFRKLIEVADRLAALPRTQLMTLLDSFQRDNGITAYINLIYQARRSPELHAALGLADLKAPFTTWAKDSPLLLRERPECKNQADTALADLIVVSRLRSDPPSLRETP